MGIINNAWKIGKSPDVWKYEEAVMLPKPGKDTLKIKNHRYITFSPVIGKVMERMIKKRLEVVMDQKKNPDIQCGFRKNRSAEDSPTCLKQEALFTFQNGWILAAVLLNIQGAFDSMLHRKMIGGLITADSKGQILTLLEDYLKGRRAKVRIGETLSETTVFSERGIPQDSALGPGIYNVGSFDIPCSEKDEDGTVFVDDNNVWAMARDTEQIKTLIAQVLEKLENGLKKPT